MRHSFIALALVLSTSSSLSAVRAQDCIPPGNEDCDGAFEFTFSQLPLNVSGQLLGCENDLIDRPYFDVFFQYTCTVAGDYQFDMCDALGDTYMRIYTGGCGFLSSTSQVEDDDACPAATGSPNTLDPLIVLTLEEGTTYWIELGAWRVDDFFPPNANDPYEFNVQFLGAEVQWSDLGGGSAGSQGVPVLVGSGPLTAGSSLTLDLSGAASDVLALGLLSFDSLPLDLFGGTLHTLPIAGQALFVTDPAGLLSVDATWPSAVPPGTCVWFQFLTADLGATDGIALSNAVKAAAP